MVVVKVMVWKLLVPGSWALRRNVIAAPTMAPPLSLSKHGQNPPELAGIGLGQAPATRAGHAPVVVVSVASVPESRFHVPPPPSGRSSRSPVAVVLAASRRKQYVPRELVTSSESADRPPPEHGTAIEVAVASSICLRISSSMRVAWRWR